MEPVLVILIGVIVIVIPIAIAVALLRGIFRVNEITDLLIQIRDNTAKPKPKREDPFKRPVSPPTGACDSCKKTFDLADLTKLEIGKTVCPACKKFIKS